MESFSFRTLNLIELQSKQVQTEVERKEEENSRLDKQLRNKEVRYLKEHRSFQSIKDALALKSGTEGSRESLVEARKLASELVKKKQVVQKAKSELEETKGQKNLLVGEIVKLRKKSDTLGVVAKTGLNKLKKAKELSAAEGIIEEAIQARSVAGRKADKGDLERFEINKENLDLEQRVEFDSKEILESREVAEPPTEIVGSEGVFDNTVGTSGGDGGSHSRGRPDSQSDNGQQNQKFSDKPQKSHSFQDIAFTNGGNTDSFIRQIEEVSSWKSLGSSGVELSYTTDSGKKIRVEIIGNSSHAISVKIKPENLRQKQTLWYERAKIIEALSQSGLKVIKVEVG